MKCSVRRAFSPPAAVPNVPVAGTPEHRLKSGNLSACFAQVVTGVRFRFKALIRQGLAIFLTLLVASDCCGSIGNRSSTVLAQSRPAPRCLNLAMLMACQAVVGLALRFPLKLRNNRPLRVLIYARYSTEEQDRSSIPDQFAFCRRTLAQWYEGPVEFIELSDSEMSGELTDRPGINEARKGIERGAYDVIMAEDSSRLFRNPGACMDFANKAVDAGMRLLFPNDEIDSAEPDWDEELLEAQKHHCRSNKYTRKRILRRFRALWEMGAAIGQLCPGYRREATKAAACGERAEGPFFDYVDESWVPAMIEAYERIARHESPWSVADWLTAVGMPLAANAKGTAWTDRSVISFIRRLDHRGVQTRRKTVARKMYQSGKTIQERNTDPNEIWSREMERLRVVSDDLWFRANDAIDSHNKNKNPIQGRAHPLAGIPRDSRFPLSNLLVCGVCGRKMHREGRGKGGYRCGNVPAGLCWNRATALESVVHETISKVLSREILAGGGGADVLVRAAQQRLAHSGIDAECNELRKAIKANSLQQERLVNALESGNTELSVVQERLTQRQHEFARLQAALAALEDRQRTLIIPSPDEIRERIAALAAQVLSFDRSISAVLPQLISSPIRAVPYRQLGGKLVVLRAHFTLQLQAIVPEQLYRLLTEQTDCIGELVALRPVEIVVDLFKPKPVPANALPALALSQVMKPKKICEELGITRRIMDQALVLGRAMAEQGLSDLYEELRECPADASRWRPRRKPPPASQDDAA